MDKDWIPIVAALVGGFIAVIGGIVAGFFSRSNIKLQLKHQSEQERVKLNLSKYEELYTQLLELQKASYWFRNHIYQNNNQPYTTEWSNKLNDDFLLNLNKILTYVAIYTPELEEDIQKLNDATIKLQTSGNEMLIQKNLDKELLNQHFLNLIRSCQRVQEKIQLMFQKTSGLITK
ncbi:MAG: hypothetical protein ACR2LT_00270 [Pyrinomonadaceae bacterium]